MFPIKKRNRFTALAVAMLLLLSSCGETSNLAVDLSSLQPDPSPSEMPTPTGDPEPTPTPVPQDTEITLSFGGDILLHTPVFTTADQGDGTYDFSHFLQYDMTGFFDADWNMVNMENPVDVYGDNSKISSYPSFNAPREVMDFTSALGVDTVAYCNNHIYDKGYTGFLATLNNLRESLDVAGAYASEEEYNTPYIRDVKGVKVGLVCFTNLVNSYYSERVNRLEPYSVHTFNQNTAAVPTMVEEIQAVRDAGAELVVVYLHWGSEYRDAPSNTQKELARLLCEGGADLIVGGHSHCVQPAETYTYTTETGAEKTSLILYSLGNFFADQTGLQSNEKYGPSYAKTQYGMKVTVRVKKDGVTGEVTVEGGEYEPTCLLRRRVNGRYDYRFLASGRYALSETMPDIFPNEATWKKCIAAYDHVTGIVGTDVLSVHDYEQDELYMEE